MKTTHDNVVKGAATTYEEAARSVRDDAVAKIARAGGALYDANYDPELVEAIAECMALCAEYNGLHPADETRRAELLAQILGSVGEGARIWAPFWCDYGRNVRVGRNFFGNRGLQLLDAAPITFGDDVFVGPNCVFATAGHPLESDLRRQGLEYARPISVGDDVWFGMGALVCPGVTIGSRSVVAAGAVVTRDVEDGCLVAGVPARVVKRVG